MNTLQKHIRDASVISAPSLPELFAIIRVLPWRSLRIVKSRGRFQAIATTWSTNPNRAKA